ncbi:hypothetical protein EDB81DRAFT_950811 [Dactylonectria macrodidyma]|uniref:Uncharacterized protein n=1 Tax=Dactylonectria macrodidyma TaxID=307937 RepID=A0A9P9E1U9_9HYPO|nr:hypothetical protein EDB81DRAFT_950811 [Dactylonectria macrodidyma]
MSKREDIKGLIARVKSRIPLAQSSPDLKVMTTIGVDLGTIVFVDDLSFTHWHDVPHELGRIRRALRDHISTRVACDAFMVQNDQYRNLCEQEKRKASADFSKLWGLVSGSVFEYSQSEDFQWICEMVAHGLTNDRTVFVTDSGKAGMSPCSGVRKGDKLAGLFSINFPMVLRRIGMPASGQYIMVCVAHVGCHEWRHDLPERDLGLPTLAWSLGMKSFTIH